MLLLTVAPVELASLMCEYTPCRPRRHWKRLPCPRLVPWSGGKHCFCQHLPDGIYVYGGHFISLRSTAQPEGEICMCALLLRSARSPVYTYFGEGAQALQGDPSTEDGPGFAEYGYDTVAKYLLLSSDQVVGSPRQRWFTVRWLALYS